MKYVLHVTSALVLAGVATPALAQQSYSFTYTTVDNNVETGTLYGLLASDGNHFTVTGNGAFTYNGQNFAVSGPPVSVDAFAGVGTGYNGSGKPVVTVDGSYMDYLSNDPATPFTAFAVNDQYPSATGQKNFSQFYNPPSVNDVDTFNPSRFSASVSPVAAAPEPATWAMMFLGLGVAGYALSRKRKGPVTTNIAFA